MTAAEPAQARPAGRIPPIVIVEGREQMPAMEPAWKRLSEQSARPNPFLAWEWQRAWLETQAEPLVAMASFPDGSPAGLLALQRKRRRGLRQLEFLGHGSGADDLDCMLHRRAGPDTATRLLAAVRQRRNWDLMRLEGARWNGALAAAGKSGACGIEAGEWLPYLDLPASFDAYLASQSANFRAEVRRRQRRFFREAPGARLECAESPAAVGAALEHLFRLHNLRRAQKRGRGLFESSVLRRFHRRAAGALAAGLRARVYLLHGWGQPVAALYGLQAGGHFLYFQSGFDPAWTRWSPGTVLLAQAVEDSIGRGLRQFDFLRGEEMYKARWTRQRRRGVNILAAGSWAGRAYLGLRHLRRSWAPPVADAEPPTAEPANEGDGI